MSADPGAARGFDGGQEPLAGAAGGPGGPSEEELRAAYEAELSRITTTDMLAQTVISLLNLGARRLGSPSAGGQGPGQAGDAASGQTAGAEQAPAGRDLDQVRDAIDGVRALMGILERRLSGELAPLRDALSQLQMAYAREVQMGSEAATPAEGTGTGGAGDGGHSGAGGGGAGGAGGPGDTGRPGGDEQASAPGRRPGPAETSGRLWVPGR